MVRQVTSWKAALAIMVAGGALLWHVLACTESPMSFSAKGDLAFVIVEPYDLNNMEQAGTHDYRLMVLSADKKLRVLEETTEYMLTAPAFDVEGKRLAYLRIPLMNEKDAARLDALAKQITELDDKKQGLEQAANQILRPAPATEPTNTYTDLILPPVTPIRRWTISQESTPKVLANLVVRAVEGGALFSLTPVVWPGFSRGEDAAMTYLTANASFGADGQRIYVNANNLLLAINPATNEELRLGAAVSGMSLSPNGKTLATLQERVIGFIQTEGQTASYRRMRAEPSFSGLTWVDDRTLAVIMEIHPADGNTLLSIDFLHPDGEIIKTLGLPIQFKDDKGRTEELAAAKDGKHFLISFGDEVVFLDSEGKIVGHWEAPDNTEEVLADPAFTPDSKQVAMKRLTKGAYGTARTAEIVFFTAEGKEVSRIAVPAMKAGTTRPAFSTTQAWPESQPAPK